MRQLARVIISTPLSVSQLGVVTGIITRSVDFSSVAFLLMFLPHSAGHQSEPDNVKHLLLLLRLLLPPSRHLFPVQVFAQAVISIQIKQHNPLKSLITRSGRIYSS